MYLPTQFEETRLDALHALIAEHPLGAVITSGTAGLGAEHVPFEIGPADDAAPFGVLRAHVARANPLWQCSGQSVLALFQGPSAYISPSLYEEKAISGKVVPTYNYAVVHAHGTLRAIEDPVWLFALLERLSAHHESARAAPWSLHDAPLDYVDKLMGAIVGIEIPIERLQGKWKASQNRSPADRVSIAAELNQRIGGAAVAALVRAQTGA